MALRDFRTGRFKVARVEKCGSKIGSDSYAKLYVVENVLRVALHSVLTAQIGPHWPTTAFTPAMQKDVAHFRARYLARPKHASPGKHDIYLLYLRDLALILRANRAQFDPVLRDVDRWLLRLDNLHIPRNLVGHMNVPNPYDRSRIEQAFRALGKLLAQIRESKIPVLIP